MTQILRLTQSPPSQGEYNVRIELQREGEYTQSTDVSFEFNLSLQDQERLRWYFEDYLQYPQDPAPSIAGKIEGQLTKIGIELFEKIFKSKSNFDAHKIWSYALPQLNNTRIEIVTEVQEATTIPWELICNPDTLQPLALGAGSFLRTYSQAAVPPKFKKTTKGPIRILLAICRPGADNDVPFRSVASRVISGLSKEGGSRFQLDLLRPPTFDQLGRVLRKAKDEGKPYHVLHFDGHGTYADLGGSAGLGGVNRNTFASQRPGPCGYLLFENPRQEENLELVDGTSLGNLLREAEVPILVLNACRSAYAQSPNEPASAQDEKQMMDAHSRVRAFGSLAQEVMHAGSAGVVAMRYVVYVVTAAQFVAELYDSLAHGRTLEEAVNLGRKNLHDQPKREIAFRKRELQDWSVPVVFEVGTLALFPRQKGEKKFEIKIRENEAIPERGYLDSSLPPSPDMGFFGRDETLQAIDRAFDSHKIVLLHAYAGNGKTATAAEFARWYSLTGGVDGPVLFTSLERHMPLPRVLDKIGQAFGKTLEQQGIHWLTLNDEQRLSLALLVLKQIPVLWIWDNVEPVAGFPTGTESAWSTEEQQDLANFLRAARDTQAKFLLTSRRDEREWLGDLPRRVLVPPMPMFERMELARAIADKQGNRMVDVESWRQLLRYTEGNPLTITVLVGQVLREGLGTKEQIEGFVEQLRSGEKEIEDDESQGRSKSLGASLRYGSENAFDEKDRSILALLSFFQGFVDVNALMNMGRGSFSLEDLRGLEREDGMKLLDRAAEVGMLTALGGGYYRIHPALPWFFQGLFHQYYKGREDEAARAFVEAMGHMGTYLKLQYVDGYREVASVLAAEKANLLYARKFALKKGWWRAVVLVMQGLRWYYNQTGRWMEWRQLVDEIVPFFMDLKTDGFLPDLEDEGSRVMEYRVKLSIQSQKWDEALRLQKKSVHWHLQKAGPALAAEPHNINERGRNDIRNYIISMADLARIQMEKGDAGCVLSYKEAIEKSETYGLGPEAAAYSMNLGNAYMDLVEIRDLDKAEYWFRRGLDLAPEPDGLGRGQCLGSLGNVAHERFWDSLKAGKPEGKHLEAAWKSYQQALMVIPPNAADELAVTHNALAAICDYSGWFEKALRHYQLAIRYKDELGDIYSAAQFRRNVALNLIEAGRLPDALEYACSAREKFEACGPAGAKELQETQEMIADLEETLRSK
ncbi:MAG: CHAT domain-containing protein [Methanothrix sp.]|nr:CHAT domain-containing protein [Methanothrix sp.]